MRTLTLIGWCAVGVALGIAWFLPFLWIASRMQGRAVPCVEGPQHCGPTATPTPWWQTPTPCGPPYFAFCVPSPTPTVTPRFDMIMSKHEAMMKGFCAAATDCATDYIDDAIGEAACEELRARCERTPGMP